jgi:hypothetical protein
MGSIRDLFFAMERILGRSHLEKRRPLFEHVQTIQKKDWKFERDHPPFDFKACRISLKCKVKAEPLVSVKGFSHLVE